MLAQMAAATSCDQALKAAFIYPAPDAGACPIDSCSAIPGQWTTCLNTTVYTSRCDGPLWLDAGACKPFDGGTAACNQVSGCTGLFSQCLNNVAQSCFSKVGLDIEIDCSVQGRSCELSAAHTAQCTQLCASPTTLSWGCENGSVLLCGGTFVQSAYNCTGAGRSCETSSAGVPYCGAPTDACTPLGASVNQCSGSSISLCVDGQPKSFDCSSLPGGQSCRAASASQTAHCGP
jgi:hypothetical protein